MGMNLKQKEISKDSPEEAMDMRKMVAVDEKYITRSYFKEDKNSDSPITSKKSSSKNCKNNHGRKLAEVFRTDFITAMKVPESQQLPPGKYMTLKDTWRQEWEKGVQVPVNPESILKPVSRKINIDLPTDEPFSLPEDFIKFDQKKYLTSIDRSNTSCNYDLDEQDVEWLKGLSSIRSLKKATTIDELTMERAITWFERECFEKMAHAVATKEGLSIEYDESTTCHVCLSPDAEDGNEIIFCDACMMCVHQHCYGVLEIPEGSWLCNPCSRGILSPPCCLCPNKGGAMKRMKDSFEWIHVICAWWIPEVKIEDVRYIERITKDKIPGSRWNLMCYICREKMGACIQCSVKRCVRAYHVTCAVKDGLEMKTVVIPEQNDVQHISFCSKHCTPVPPDNNLNRTKSEDFENNRLKELRKLESEFYSLVSIKKASRELKLCKESCRRLLSYWAMKRRANENVPLIKLTLEQQEKLSGKQGVVFINQQKTLEMERFLLLRQDLERLRNLCYMIVRREKMRKELHRLSVDVFYKQNDILLDDNEDLSGHHLDFIRHRTTRFSCFSEYYQTDQQYEDEHGVKLNIFDSTLEEGDELLNSSQLEKFDIKDIARVTGVKYLDNDENSGIVTDTNESTIKTEPDRNIFELLEPDPAFEKRRASTPDIDVQHPELISSYLESNVNYDDNIHMNGYYRDDAVCVLDKDGKKIDKIPVSNNSVTSRLVKKGKKRFRNLHGVGGVPNRNSPRLHKFEKLSDEADDHESEIKNRNDGFEEDHMSKMMKDRKRRRLNSFGDCVKEFDEIPDYVRVTRSRLASCS